MAEIKSLFPERVGDVSDEGFLSVASYDNMIAYATLSGTFYNAFSAMFDPDPTTFTTSNIGPLGAYTRYTMFDMRKVKKNVLLGINFRAKSAGSTATTTVTVQISDNGSDWVDKASVSTFGGTVDKNYSAVLSMRYVRVRTVVATTGSAVNEGRIYFIQVSRVND